ncbi:hypothetical protein Mpsy_1613 [Methanolobus psychrophilus R15]|nr:hypothetical protein Mpsy_1613 [Methanolobus psychrophilus R15]
MGFYPREKQITEVRQVDTSRKPAVVPCEEIKPRYLGDVHAVTSHKEPDFELREEVTINTKNTTVIESREAPKEQPPKKRKSLDEVMNLDLPDNYEEEFWK